MFFLFFNTGPINAALVNCVPPSLRALAVSINILCIHVFGDVPATPLIGAVADAFNLRIAVAMTALPVALGAVVLFAGARRTAVVPTAAPSGA
jgi:hypothetical protein